MPVDDPPDEMTDAEWRDLKRAEYREEMWRLRRGPRQAKVYASHSFSSFDCGGYLVVDENGVYRDTRTEEEVLAMGSTFALQYPISPKREGTYYPGIYRPDRHRRLLEDVYLDRKWFLEPPWTRTKKKEVRKTA